MSGDYANHPIGRERLQVLVVGMVNRYNEYLAYVLLADPHDSPTSLEEYLCVGRDIRKYYEVTCALEIERSGGNLETGKKH